jgi:hypothetical protein
MNRDARLASLFSELSRLEIPCLVMGGHAVRFYGIDRSTLDYDFHLALDQNDWENLPTILSKSSLFSAGLEGPSWRPGSFRRFVVGTLSDGREERAEFWRENHLLAPFPVLLARAERGPYGGAEVQFLGLEDLIRSKETEREDDWRDIRLLEEISDERRLAGATSKEKTVEALAHLRSQRGLDLAAAKGHLTVAADAWRLAKHPLSMALLAPYARASRKDQPLADSIGSIVDGPLKSVDPASARHRALVEAVRRLYMKLRMAEDRADKERTASNSGR